MTPNSDFNPKNETIGPRNVTNDQLEFVVSIQKCADNQIPQFTNSQSDLGRLVFNDIAIFSENIHFIDPLRPLLKPWLNIIQQIDQEYPEPSDNQMNQIAQISKSLQKQLERCEDIDTNEVDMDNANIFDDKFIEDQLKQIDERTKSLADIDTRALNSLQLSPERQAKYPS